MPAYRYQCNSCKFIQVVNMNKGKRPKKTIQGFCSKSKSHNKVTYTLVEDRQ